MGFIPRWYQKEAFDAVVSSIINMPNGCPLVAMPTGTGKSPLAAMISLAFMGWWGWRGLICTHVKELVEQDSNAVLMLDQFAPMGICSAGLKRDDTAMALIVGGIQTMYKKPAAFGWRDFLVIDEAHLLSPKDAAMYQVFIKELKKVNPNLIVIGLTATPYRMGQGMLTDDGLFSHICYDLTTIEAFDRLIREGYLCPPVPKKMKLALDVHDVDVGRNGDYNLAQLQKKINKTEITFAALRETCEYGVNRQSWIIFASGKDHAEDVARMLNGFGVPTGVVHDGIKDTIRDQTIADFKAGRLRAISNNNILTTGFDHKPIDLISILRPTLSTTLHVQMIGRGMRPWHTKKDCLVLDFARNTANLGPINDPKIPKKKGKGGGDAPVKICDHCGTYNHTRAVYCIGCGAQFEFKPNIVKTAGTLELLRTPGGVVEGVAAPILEYYNVDRCTYSKHQPRSDGKSPSLKVSYFCGLALFHRYIPFEHEKSNVRHLAKEWWMQRHASECPLTVDEALQYQSYFRTPTQIVVHVNKEYPSVEQELFQ